MEVEIRVSFQLPIVKNFLGGVKIGTSNLFMLGPTGHYYYYYFFFYFSEIIRQNIFKLIYMSI